MGRGCMYSPEVRERAVRMVLEHTAEYDSQWAAILSIAGKIGCSPETLRTWLRQAERDQGLRPGLTTDERKRLQEQEREIRELRRANVLKKMQAGSIAELVRLILEDRTDPQLEDRSPPS